MTTPALAGPAHGAAGKTVTFHFYSVVSTLVLTHKDGTTIENPAAPPAIGDRLEITENAYTGTHKSHSTRTTPPPCAPVCHALRHG